MNIIQINKGQLNNRRFFNQVVFTFTFLLFVRSLSGQISYEVQFPDCSLVQEIDFDTEVVLSSDVRFLYLRATDTLESLYCFSKKTNNVELEAISLYRLALEYEEAGPTQTMFSHMIYYLEKSMQLSEENNFNEHLIMAKEVLCSSFTSNKSYSQALIYANEIILLAHEMKDSTKIAMGYMVKGRILREQELYEQSDSILQIALSYHTDSAESNRISAYTALHLCNQKVIEKKYKEAIHYGEMGLRFAENADNHKDFLNAVLAVELLISKIESGILDNEDLYRLIESYSSQTKSVWVDSHYHYTKGLMYEKKGDINGAIMEYTIGIENSYEAGSTINTLKSCKRLMPILLSEGSNHDLINKIYIILNETINEILAHRGADNLFSTTYFKLKNEMDNNKHLERSLGYYNRIFIFSVCIIVLLLLSGGLLSHQNRLKKKYNLTLNTLNEKLKEKNINLSYLNKKIESRKDEVSRELKHQLLTISSFRNQVHALEDFLTKSDDINSSTKRQALRMLNFDSNKGVTEQINFKFIELHQSFVTELCKKYPGLTNNDIKLCLYLKMNLSSKEISQILHRSPEAIKVARSRLRKKLKISNTKGKISALLNTIEFKKVEYA